MVLGIFLGRTKYPFSLARTCVRCVDFSRFTRAYAALSLPYPPESTPRSLPLLFSTVPPLEAKREEQEEEEDIPSSHFFNPLLSPPPPRINPLFLLLNLIPES